MPIDIRNRRDYHKRYYREHRKDLLTKMAARYQANKKQYKERDNNWRKANRKAIYLSRKHGIRIAEAREMLKATTNGVPHASQ